jgi:Pentapeptide repeats (8 copies)
LTQTALQTPYLSSADLRSANLRSANLGNAYLGNADLSSANFNNADLSSANLNNANLSSAYLRSADLRSAYLGNANLSSADLSNADLSNANLRNADLSSIVWNNETRWANATGLHEASGVPEALQQTPQFAASLTLSQGIDWVQQGRIEEALEAYQQAQQIDASLEISADSWQILCWYGCLYGFAEQVLFAGENAVNIDPDNKHYKDDRGLARGLTWDYPGALIDFEEVLGSDVFQHDYRGEEREQRQRWVEVLRQGRNPFTEEELQELRDRYLRS